MKKGFTLVETLVAITIMLLVIVGPMTVAQKGIQTAYFSTQQATAVFLAQEAIESVRELRDGESLDVFAGDDEHTDDWADDLGSACEVGCRYTGSGFETCEGGDCAKLNFIEGEFTHDLGGSESPFSRVVSTNVNNGIVEVDVVVDWKTTIFGGFTPREVRLQTWVYDHYERYEP
jgi:prepilin-type N-terminal cleavage/methylation domain-containing protein